MCYQKKSSKSSKKVQSFEQLGMCTQRLTHKDKIARRFFVVPEDIPVLLGMSDFKLLEKVKIMCEVVVDQQANRKLDSQTTQPCNGPSCKANKSQHIKTENAVVNDANPYASDYLRSSISKAAD